MHEDSIWIWIGVPDVDIVDFGGKKVFIVQRYERVIGGTSIKRLHQEDFCQALGLMSEQKYESDGGPGIAAIFNLIKKNFSRPIIDQRDFLKMVVFNFFVGNCFWSQVIEFKACSAFFCLITVFYGVCKTTS